MNETVHQPRVVNSYLSNNANDADISLLRPHKQRRLDSLGGTESNYGSVGNTLKNASRYPLKFNNGECTNQQPHSSSTPQQSFDIFKVLEDNFNWYQPKTANSLYLGEGSTSTTTTDCTKNDTLDCETNICDGGGGDTKRVEDYNIFDTLRKNFAWFKDGYTNSVSDNGNDFESRENDDVDASPYRIESGDSISESHSLPCDWTRLKCTPGGNCNNINCLHIDKEDEQDSNNDGSTPPSFIRGKRIRISGRFNAHGISQDKCKSMLLKAGALEVKMNTTFGDADILIAGSRCGQSLLDYARRGGKLILSYPQLISRLQLEGYSTSNAAMVIDESKLADELISEKCQFKVVNSKSSNSLKLQCNIVLPKELNSRGVFNNDGLVVEVAQYEFSDPLLTGRNNTERQMKIRVTRIKGKDGSEWQDHYKFFYKKQERNRTKWTHYCVQHNREHRTCGKCNSCPHGFGSPHIQCTDCCPWILCIDCGIEPRLPSQPRDERYVNRCARCYRIASGGMTFEDRCIKYILDSHIPVSSINRYVFGLPYRPDAEITASPLNDISYECDHDDRSSYPEDEQHQRTVELNKCRPENKGKITIRQHPLDITDTVRQESQNALLVSTIKEYMNEDLGQREDGQGKRITVFIGHSCSNYHYEKALEEKESGYWDEVRLISPFTHNRKYPEPEV